MAANLGGRPRLRRARLAADADGVACSVQGRGDPSQASSRQANRGAPAIPMRRRSHARGQSLICRDLHRRHGTAGRRDGFRPADEVSPIVAGIAYCQVIAFARRSSTYVAQGVDRGSALPLVRLLATSFVRNCLVPFRCEIFQLQGVARRGRRGAAGVQASLGAAWDSLGSLLPVGWGPALRAVRGTETPTARPAWRGENLSRFVVAWMQRGESVALASIRRVLEAQDLSIAPNAACLRRDHGRRGDVETARATTDELTGTLRSSTPYLMLSRVMLPPPSVKGELRATGRAAKRASSGAISRHRIKRRASAC